MKKLKEIQKISFYFRHHFIFFNVIPMFLILLISSVIFAGNDLGNIGTFDKWKKIEITMTGPNSVGTGSPNPFSIFVDVTFTGPSGQTYTVPGFYDGNNNGGLDGNTWKVRFSADENGTWIFVSNSTDIQLDGYTGSFTVNNPSPNAPDFYRWGRLEYVGTAVNKIRYLKFRDGSYWLKAGSDDPENFLGNFSNYNTLDKRKAAIDYLASKGINSQYIMTHNVGGDDQDVWPWLGSSMSQAKSNGGSNARFDIDKLNEWLELFEYMQTKGVVPYIILEDDSAWKSYDHDRYYRELIARFGHMPTLLFNIGEEHNENYGLSTALSYAQQVKDIDPYDHPVGIHNVNSPSSTYINASQVDFTAIQTSESDALRHNGRTIDWINQCKSQNRRILMVGYDEPRPLMDRKGWWSAYIGGGVWEVHTDKPYDRPMSTWEPAWSEIGGARVFMESIPFWEMEPDNMSVTSGTAFALVKPGEVYALYLPSGGAITVNLTTGNTYNYSWWNPTNSKNGNFQNSGTVEGGNQLFTAPGSGDWVLRIVKASGSGNSAPIASDTNIAVAPGNSIDINLSYTDPDGPGPYTFTITQNPTNGTLSGSGNIRTYTANLNASGGDLFKWKVNDGLADSNEATVNLSISAGNNSPIAKDQLVTTAKDTIVSIPLSYEDVDGPGPYTFTIVQPPANGTAVPDQIGSNDFIYTPNGGFTGTDTFTWKVNDGLKDSNVATVTFVVKESSQLVISNLTVGSGRNYEVVKDGLQTGAVVYIDRSYTYSSVPALVQGATYIKTANSDKGSSGTSFLTFGVNQDVIVYVAHDDRITIKPSWMASFTDTVEDLITTDTTFSIFAKDFPSGTITLGGNDGSGNSMYTLVIVGQGNSIIDIIPPSSPKGLIIQ